MAMTRLPTWKLGLLLILCVKIFPNCLAYKNRRALCRTKPTSTTLSMKGWDKRASPMVGMVTASIAVVSNFLSPSFVLADGEANLAFFQKEKTVKIGESIYNENDKVIIKEKLAKTKTNWDNMIKKIEKSINANALSSAKDAISGPLFQLKADMRLLSKLACNGDIYVRAKPGAEANFDYNSGQFELQRLAQDAEVTIDDVNDLYFYGLDRGKEAALSELSKTEEAFDKWYSDVESILKQ